MPTTQELATVRALLAEVYARELGDSTAAGKRNLANKLYEVAKETTDAPADRYELLSEAAQLAGSAGDSTLAMFVAGVLSEEYASGSAADVLAATLGGRVGVEGLPEWEIQNLLRVCVTVAEAAASKGDASAAEALLNVLKATRARASNVRVPAEIETRERLVRERLGAIAKVEEARKTLARNPGDEASTTIVGRHLCFSENNWHEGLPLLAKGTDTILRSLAVREVASPTTASAQAALADAWWDYAAKADKVERQAILKHAASWYARSVNGLTGLRREVARKRISDAGPEVEAESNVGEHVPLRVVFVCDATGTMLGLKYKLLQKQVYKAIESLSSQQSFNVIFFLGGDSDAEWARPFSTKLESATPEAKANARTFVERLAVGGKGTNPLPALRRALQSRPEVVYFLTDGEFNNVVSYEQVIAEVRKMNASKAVRLNTIAFMSDDERAEQALKQLASENGGNFRKVSDRDLD
jgi:hypothetical protein